MSTGDVDHKLVANSKPPERIAEEVEGADLIITGGAHLMRQEDGYTVTLRDVSGMVVSRYHASAKPVSRASYYGFELLMPDNSFDVASKIDMTEVLNAVQQASKEIQTRYDLKDSKSSVELNEKDHKILLASSDEFKLKAVTEILGQKLVKRNVPLKGLEYGTLIQASGGSVKQEITLQQGISTEKAKDVVKTLKDSKLKVQASIQGDVVRVSGKDRDTLQQAIALLRGKDFGIDMQFINFRTN